jgi:fructose-1-phosphate kinase PfkB-like protein
MCGSFLPGTPPEGPSELVKAASAAGLKVILDTYGPALDLSLAYRPALVKINRQEAGGVLNKSINTPAEALQAAADIQALGPQAVVITLGAAGAVGLDAAGQTFGWASPRVNSLCPVGSGDSLLAGVVTGLGRGQSLKEATRLGVAAGAANTLQLGPGLFDPAMVQTLLAQIEPLV